MDINLLLKGINCECGKFHTCNIDYVYIEKDAINRLTHLCDSYKSILIVADDNTYLAAGEKTENTLTEKQIKKVIFDGKSLVIPNEAAIQKITEKTEGVDLIIGIGSGVIQDLCKYVSFFEKIPYMIVATAPSMDGYASDGAAMILKGMKETVKATLPKAIIADTKVLKNAPMDMIKAGFGDVIGKYSALCDWRLSNIVNGEYLCEYIYDTTYDMIQNTLDNTKGLILRDEKSIKALTEALIVIGIMMSFAGSSRPASGSEHHLSHFFEITGIVDNNPYFPHGIDVAYSTVITSRIREEIMEKAFPEVIFRLGELSYLNEMQKVYKHVANGCIALQEKVGNYSANRLDVYNEKKHEIFKLFKEFPSSQEITNMLKIMEFDINEFYAMYGMEKIKDAVLYAKDLKDRYTVLWMNYDLFGGQENEF